MFNGNDQFGGSSGFGSGGFGGGFGSGGGFGGGSFGSNGGFGSGGSGFGGSGFGGFGGGNQPQSRFKTLFDSSGKPTTVFDSGPHTLTVSGADTTCGTHFKSGNTVFGRDGVHTVVEAGSLKTVLGPHGEVRTIYQNGHDGTIL